MVDIVDILEAPGDDSRLGMIWVWSGIPDSGDIELYVSRMVECGIGRVRIDVSRIRDSSPDQIACAVDQARVALESRGLRFVTDEAWAQISDSVDPVPSSGLDGTLIQLKREIDRRACLGKSDYWLLGPPCYASDRNGLILSRETQPFHSYSAILGKYAHRLSNAMSLGERRSQVAVLASGRWQRRPDIDRLVSQHVDLYRQCLSAQHLSNDSVSDDDVAHAAAIDGKLFIGGTEYDMLVVPPLTEIAIATAFKIGEFVEEGGCVLGSVIMPWRDSTGLHHNEVREVFSSIYGVEPEGLYENRRSGANPVGSAARICNGRAYFTQSDQVDDLAALVKEIAENSVRRSVSLRWHNEECSAISFAHVVSDDVEAYFFANDSDREMDVQMSIRCDRAPHAVDLETGSVTALANCTQVGNRTVLLRQFLPFGSLLLLFGDEPSFVVSPETFCDGDVCEAVEEWDFRTLQPNRLPLRDWEIVAMDSAERVGEYLAIFDAESPPDDIKLLFAIGQEPVEWFEGDDLPYSIYVNGDIVEVCGLECDGAYRAFDVAGSVVPGQNEVRIVINRPATARSSQKPPSAVWLTGSFTVGADRRSILPETGKIKSGSWTDQGYPFYSGAADYSVTVDIPPKLRSQRVLLCAKGACDVVEFIVNGASVALRPWAPTNCDITDHTSTGPVDVVLRVTNTLANAVGGIEQPSGLINGVRVVIY